MTENWEDRLLNSATKGCHFEPSKIVFEMHEARTSLSWYWHGLYNWGNTGPCPGPNPKGKVDFMGSANRLRRVLLKSPSAQDNERRIWFCFFIKEVFS